MRFLLVEDNSDLAVSIQERLAMDGHGVDWAANLQQAEDCLSGAVYDLILLDVMLPDGNGKDFLARHRSADRNTPVIVTTARNEVTERVEMLDLGADDYITKPYEIAELEARCRAVLRRNSGAANNSVKYANIEFSTLSATVKIGDDIRELRNREFRLLELFLTRPDQIFSKTVLHDRLFSYAEQVSDNAIEVYIGRLRKKLEGADARIETVRGIGYRLTKS